MKKSKKLLALTLVLALALALAPGAFATVTTLHSFTNVSLDSETIPTSSDSNDYTATLEADTGYMLPASVSVRIGSIDLDAVDFTWNPSTGVLTVLRTESHLAAAIADDGEVTLSITALADPGIEVTYAIGTPGPPLGEISPAFPTGGFFAPGDEFVLPALSTDAHYTFEGWSVSVGSISPDGSYEVPEVAAGTTIAFTADWSQNAERSVTYDSGAASGVTNMPASPVTIYENESFTAAAAPSRAGYVFTGWLANWGDPPAIYAAGASIPGVTDDDNPEGNLTLTAQWQLPAIPWYWIYSSAGTGGTITLNGNNTFPQGASATYVFTPAAGYVVQAVYVDGVPVSVTNNRYTFTNISSDHRIHVDFSAGVVDIPATGDDAPLGAAPFALLGLFLAAAGVLGFQARKRRNSR